MTRHGGGRGWGSCLGEETGRGGWRPRHESPIWVGLARRVGGQASLEPVTEPWGEGYDHAQVLLLDEGALAGQVSLEASEMSELDPESLFAGYPLGPRPVDLSDGPPITVVIGTRERPDSLRRCLSTLKGALGPHDDILVVDNAPTTSATADVVAMASEEMAVRRVVEPRPGLSRARNLGLAEAAHDLVAFTDDDVLVDRAWLSGVRRGFGRGSEVAVVTGLVPAAELLSESQRRFDAMMHWSERVIPEVYTMTDRDRYPFPFPYMAGHFGTGANMSVRRDVVGNLGGFDEALGPGTRCRAGEDLELFVRVLRRGWTLAFEPGSIVWHVHRRSEDDLRRQLFGYGSGLTAYLTCVALEPGRADLARQVLRGAGRFARTRQRDVSSGLAPRLLVREAAGMAWGPVAYLWDRRARVSRPHH